MVVELINHHMHSTGSDGRNHPREIIEDAIKKGLSFICLTDHNERLYANYWGKGFFSKKHIQDVKKLQKEFKDRIDVGFGIEIDWTEYDKDIFVKQIKQCDFDYVLGSVHLLKIDGDYFGVNFDEETLSKKIKEIGSDEIIAEYYRQVGLLAKSGLFDCVAHLDVIKTLSKGNSLFDITSNFYKKQVLKALDEIKKSGICIEINTSGKIYKCNEVFPSLWILKEAKKRNIPLTIGADTHWLERVDCGLKEAYALARKAGYREILKFKKRKPIKVKI